MKKGLVSLLFRLLSKYTSPAQNASVKILDISPPPFSASAQISTL